MAALERLMEHRAEFVAFLRKQGASAAQADDVLQAAWLRGLALGRSRHEPSDAEPEADARRVCRCAYRLLAALKPEYAAMIERVDVSGEPVDEVARGARISRNNADVRLHRARKALRDRLEAFCGECATGGGRCGDCYCEAEDRV